MEAAAQKSHSATVLDLQVWTCYNLYETTGWGNLLSDLHVPREQWVLIGISDAFSAFVTGIRYLPDVLTVPPTKACLLCATPAGIDLNIQVHARRHLPSAVPWISEDRLLALKRRHTNTTTKA